MRNAMAMSAALHAAVIALATVGLPLLFTTHEIELTPMVVELLPVAEETPPPPPEPEPPKVEPEPPPPEPEPEPVKVEEPPPPPPPKPEPVKAPPPPPPPPEEKVVVVEPEPEPEPEPVPKVEPKPKPKPPRKPEVKVAMVELKPRPIPRAKPVRKRENFRADRIAALLNKKIEKEAPRRRPVPEKKKVPEVVLKVPPRRTPPSRLSSAPLTMSEKDAIRYQIAQCWSVPAGALEAENLRVTIRIFLNPDGSLRGAPEIVDAARMSRPGEEYFRAAAESARRAVLNPRCTPLQNLPVEKYERWRDIELTFDPKEMLGG